MLPFHSVVEVLQNIRVTIRDVFKSYVDRTCF